MMPGWHNERIPRANRQIGKSPEPVAEENGQTNRATGVKEHVLEDDWKPPKRRTVRDTNFLA
jgi:hypothetical protein